jgi:hypothetical protein
MLVPKYYLAWKHKILGLKSYALTLYEIEGCCHNVKQNFLV